MKKTSLKNFTTITILTLLLLLPTALYAQSTKIFLNNVEVTGITSQKFENVNIHFNQNGDLYITAPQYKVSLKTETTPSNTTKTTPPLTKQYYLVSMNKNPGLLGYNIEVFMNGNKIYTIDQAKSQSVFDLTPHLTKGKNKIQYKTTLAADSGKYSKAQIEIFVGATTSPNNNNEQLVLSGEQGKLKLSGEESADKWFEVEINVE